MQGFWRDRKRAMASASYQGPSTRQKSSRASRHMHEYDRNVDLAEVSEIVHAFIVALYVYIAKIYLVS